MAKQLKTQTFFYGLLAVFIFLQAAMNWDYSNPFQTASASSHSALQPTSIDFNVVEFNFLKDDPTHLGSVKVQIASSSNLKSDTAIKISVDNGLSWTNCQPVSQESSIWLCNFVFEPLVSDIEVIKLETT